VELPRFDTSVEAGAFAPPRPLRAGLALAALAVLPSLAGASDLIRPLSGFVFAGIFVAAGALRTAFACHELRALRGSADRELRAGQQSYLQTGPLEWRAAELTSPRRRLVLARAVARTERDLLPKTLPGASPLNRVALRPHIDLLRELAERLRALDRPVSASGVLQVEELLTSSESPFYARERADEARSALRACLEALEGERDDQRHVAERVAVFD
jgi:hypothetical protein